MLSCPSGRQSSRFSLPRHNSASSCHPYRIVSYRFVSFRVIPSDNQGVSLERQQYYGGSAAQSTLFPALDAALGVSHSAHSSNAFLLEMRNYMPPGSFVRRAHVSCRKNLDDVAYHITTTTTPWTNFSRLCDGFRAQIGRRQHQMKQHALFEDSSRQECFFQPTSPPLVSALRSDNVLAALISSLKKSDERVPCGNSCDPLGSACADSCCRERVALASCVNRLHSFIFRTLFSRVLRV